MWRNVVAEKWGSMGVHLGRNSRAGTGRYWYLTLECGHKVIRPFRYRAGARADMGGSYRREDARPAPKRCKCDQCKPAPAGRE